MNARTIRQYGILPASLAHLIVAAPTCNCWTTGKVRLFLPDIDRVVKVRPWSDYPDQRACIDSDGRVKRHRRHS